MAVNNKVLTVNIEQKNYHQNTIFRKLKLSRGRGDNFHFCFSGLWERQLCEDDSES